MALIDLQAVRDALPAGGELIDYDEFRKAVIANIGMLAPRSIATARKQKIFTNELIIQEDGSQKLFARLAVKGEKRSQVTLSTELAAKMSRAVKSATTTSKKVGE